MRRSSILTVASTRSAVLGLYYRARAMQGQDPGILTLAANILGCAQSLVNHPRPCAEMWEGLLEAEDPGLRISSGLR